MVKLMEMFPIMDEIIVPKSLTRLKSNLCPQVMLRLSVSKLVKTVDVLVA